MQVSIKGIPDSPTNGTVLVLTLESHEAAIEAIEILQGKKISTTINSQKYEFDVTTELYREDHPALKKSK